MFNKLRIFLLVAAFAFAGCHASLWFPNATTEPMDFSPGIWETENQAYRIIVRPDGTGQLVGYDRRGFGDWGCSSSEGNANDPETPRRDFSWDVDAPHGNSGVDGGSVRISYPNAVATTHLLLFADSHTPGYWGAMWIYPCGDPDSGYAILYKVAEL